MSKKSKRTQVDRCDDCRSPLTESGVCPKCPSECCTAAARILDTDGTCPACDRPVVAINRDDPNGRNVAIVEAIECAVDVLATHCADMGLIAALSLVADLFPAYVSPTPRSPFQTIGMPFNGELLSPKWRRDDRRKRR